MTQTGVRGYGLRAQDTISDQNCWKNASRYSSPENIVPAQSRKSYFWIIKLKLKFRNIKKNIGYCNAERYKCPSNEQYNYFWISIRNIIIYLETKFRPNRRIFVFWRSSLLHAHMCTLYDLRLPTTTLKFAITFYCKS
jgi:hypothetical protein